MVSVKRERFRFAEALKVAADFQKLLGQYCSRIQIVGSLRRELPTVKDIEILFIPMIKPIADDLFGNSKPMDVTAEILEQFLEDHLIEKRPNVNGSFTWGGENRYALHPTTGLGIDFFATTALKWWNALVMRTGGKQNNINLASSARRRGWKFEAYGAGFRHLRTGEMRFTTSESDVFEFAGLKYLQPHERP